MAEVWYKDIDNTWKPLMVDYTTYQCQAVATNYESAVFLDKNDMPWDDFLSIDTSKIKLFNPTLSSFKQEAYDLTESNIYIKDSGLYSVSFNFKITEAVYKDPIDYPGSVYPQGERTMSITLLDKFPLSLSVPDWHYRSHNQLTNTATYTNDSLTIDKPGYLISNFSVKIEGFGGWSGSANYTVLSNCSCSIKRLG